MESLRPEKSPIPIISLEQKDSFESKNTPIFYTRILNEIGEDVGYVDYQILKDQQKIMIQAIEIKDQRIGYGKAVYKYIQDFHPEYSLVSSGSMNHKTHSSQDMSDAERLWLSLVREGLAEKNESGYQMKK